MKEEDSIKARLEALTKEIDGLKTKDVKVTQVSRVESSEPCFMCNGVDHVPKDCPTYFEMRELKEECNALGMPYRKPYSPYSNTFNPGWKNHPNFSWRTDTQNANQPSQPSQPSNRWVPDSSPSSSSFSPNQSLPLEDAFKSFMQVHAKSMEEQAKINQKLLEEQQGVKEEQKVIKSQLTKLTNMLTVQEQGRLPSQPQLNPRGGHMAQASNSNDQKLKEVNAITTRSGKKVDGPTLPSTDASDKGKETLEQDAQEEYIPVPFP